MKAHEELFFLVKNNRELLRNLLPREDADRVMSDVDACLSLGPDEGAVRLRRLLQRYKPVRKWLEEELYGESERLRSQLPGYPKVPLLRYVCPCRECGYEKLFSQAPDPLPLCPEHEEPLVIAEEKGLGRECA